ncbi:uracil-DNA glycosylase [Patescibacteria group bacterium]|nr:uracil-DNA glycosylase [Patescibacteria group bacterium]
MNNVDMLKEIEKNVKGCQKCRLYKTALNPVPGEGSKFPKIVFVGEAPGKYEDESGRPFVGRAGKFLDTLLGKIGYKREEVWIGNVIKHRPPENRDPLPDEIAACKEYLTLQLQILSPTLIVTLGRFAMNYFYPEGKISRDRGRLIRAGGYNIFPIYHPAAGLRNPRMLEALEEDFMRIPAVLKKINQGDFERDSEVKEDDKSADGQLHLL